MKTSSNFGIQVEKISPTATSIFAYDDDNLVETVNAGGGVVARYSQGPNIDEPLAMLRGTTMDYYEADGLGSITSLTDTTGALAQTYTYDSFGNTVATTGALRNYFQYTGREFDTEANLYFYRARYFDPQAGRFVSEEMPYGQGRGLHGMAADAIAAGIYWHQFHPDPGPNSGGCPSCSSSGNNSQPLAIPLLRGLILAHP